MKIQFWCVAIMATLGILLTSCEGTLDIGNQNSEVGVIEGFVTDGFTRSRIQGADVTLMGKVSAQTQTGSNGSFRFSNLPAGEYEIQVNAPDYAPNNQSVTLHEGGYGSIDVTLSQGGTSTVGNNCFSINNQNLNFGTTFNELQISVQNLKGLQQNLTFDTANYPWLTLSPSNSQTIQPGGTSVWTVKLDRSQIQSTVNGTIPVNTASNSGNCNGFTVNISVQN